MAAIADPNLSGQMPLRGELPRRELAVACFVSSLAAVLLLALVFAFAEFSRSSLPDGIPSPIVEAVDWGLGINVSVALLSFTLGAVAFRRESGRSRLAFYGMFLSFLVLLIVGSLLLSTFTFRLTYL